MPAGFPTSLNFYFSQRIALKFSIRTYCYTTYMIIIVTEQFLLIKKKYANNKARKIETISRNNGYDTRIIYKILPIQKQHK